VSWIPNHQEARIVELERELAELRESVRLLLRYTDDAKLALKDVIVAGEPIADAIRRLREELADSDGELCRLTHHKRGTGCSIPDCRNYDRNAR
jgi:hypothetical protein